jgi:hypothetical protein
MNQERSEQDVRENMIFQEVRRLLDLSRGGSSGDLLASALEGRTKDENNLVKLWNVCRRFAPSSYQHPLNRGRDDSAVYWQEISEFLREQGWSAERLKTLYEGPKADPAAPSIFDGLE